MRSVDHFRFLKLFRRNAEKKQGSTQGHERNSENKRSEGDIKRICQESRLEDPAGTEEDARLKKSPPYSTIKVALNQSWYGKPPAGVELCFPIFKGASYADRVEEFLFRSQGEWYLHMEASDGFGGGSNGGAIDTLLPTVNDENAEVWAEQRKIYAKMSSFYIFIRGKKYDFRRLLEGQIEISLLEPNRNTISLPADFLCSHSVEELYRMITGQSPNSEEENSADEISKLKRALINKRSDHRQSPAK